MVLKMVEKQRNQEERKRISGEAPHLQPSNFIEGVDSILFGDGFGWKDVAAIGHGYVWSHNGICCV
ncbi:hypothetical protein SADUNF_Sadunf12G0007600 [Salix dunnii]|uniref:Uncharacterized protein n=1 Tax=Salix dunnii TaxID=1413687 RepID=A0A835MRT6_9ROSI|nr:hypothetical protein SADUNF_Sadunf12G0007600 [Salix dunnii]